MSDHYSKILMLLFLVVTFVGCSTSNYKVRSYIQEKQRVDQEIHGNAGFLQGIPQMPDESQRKKTRDVYVLEISKEDQSSPNVAISVSGDSGDNSSFSYYDDPVRGPQGTSSDADPTTIPFLAGEELQDSLETEQQFVEYKVLKDDTLQKISKKFYNSYSKWPKIYEVNKSAIKNPDNIKPGTILRIPME